MASRYPARADSPSAPLMHAFMAWNHWATSATMTQARWMASSPDAFMSSADIFISYATEDRAQAARLSAALMEQGWSVWWDREILGGQNFHAEIERALDSSRCALVLWSTTSRDKSWVLNEAGEASRQGKLVPAQIEAATTIPLAFRHLQTMDLVPWIAREGMGQFDRLLQSIAALTGPAPGGAGQEAVSPAAAEAAEPQSPGQAETLERYEREFRHAIEAQYPLDSFVKEGLRRFQQQLELSDGEVAAIEDPLLAAMEQKRLLAEQQRREEAATSQPRKPSGGKEDKEARLWRRTPSTTAKIGATGTGLFGGVRWSVETRQLNLKVFHEPLGEDLELQLVEVPAGSFQMGSPAGEEERDVYERWRDEVKQGLAAAGVDVEAQRPVQVAAFLMARFPITQAQWRLVAGWPQQERPLDPDPSHFLGDQRPVEQVSWAEAVEFCERLSARSGRRYSLPSEAQWEYACRAGSGKPFHVGATLSDGLANYDATVAYAKGPKGQYRQQTTDVGSFPANGRGLHDMHGNVWEWCLDGWHSSLAKGPRDGSAWLEPASGLEEGWREWRLLRGGSWSVVPRDCRSAFRVSYGPDIRLSDVGFRICCLPPGPS